MILQLPVPLCSADFIERGFAGVVLLGNSAQIPDDAQAGAVIEFINTASPCAHAHEATGPQIEASDAWAALNAKLAAVPAGADYDALRARLQGALAAARGKADDLGGLA